MGITLTTQPSPTMMFTLLQYHIHFIFIPLGETSAGKSTIINLILGESILPTGIKASTSRVCRVKYAERCMISTRSNNDEELENMSFKNLQEMAENLKGLAKTNNEEIGYVDIHMPAPLLQVSTCECTVFTY